MRELIDEFLSQKRIAIVGVTRSENGWGRKLYDEFKKRGYDTFAVNPARAVPGIQCYGSLSDLPMRVDGVILAVPPPVSDHIVQQCAELGIPRVWMHRGIGPGAVSVTALRFCKANHIAAIHGVCPMMYLQPCSMPHRLHHVFEQWRGRLPEDA